MIQYTKSLLGTKSSCSNVWLLFLWRRKQTPVHQVLCLVTQLCPTLCDPIDCGPPAPLSMEILQARKLEWVVISFSRGTSQPRDRTRVSHIASRFFTEWANGEVQEYWVGSLSLLQGNLPDPGIKLGSPAFRVDSLPAELPLPVVEPGLLNQSDSLSNWSITFEICSFA